MKILAIIPARSGSKGIHLKNIKKLVEVPLIEYTLNSAKKSNKIEMNIFFKFSKFNFKRSFLTLNMIISLS